MSDVMHSSTISEVSVVNTGHGDDARGSKSWLKPDSKKSFLIGVNVTTKQLDAIERFRSTLEEDVSRPHVVRMIISDWLKSRGHL